MEPEIQAADCTGADGVIQVISAVPNRQQNIRSLNAQQMITLPTTAQDDSGAPQDDTTYQEGTETLVYDMELNRYIKQRVDLLPSSTGTSKRGVETTNTQSQEDGQSKRRCFIGGRSISNSAYTDKKSNYTKNYLRSQTFKGENEDFTIEPLAPNIWKCDSPQNVLKCVDTHEKKQITQFVRRRLPDSQPKIEDLKSKRITWTLNDRHYVQKVIFRIPFNGMPSIVMQSVVRFYCRHGADMSTSAKRRYRSLHKLVRRSQSIKKDCPAFISIKEVIYFPEYQVDVHVHSKRLRLATMNRLRTAINSGIPPVMKKVYYVRIPELHEHRNHPVGEEAAGIQKMDIRIRDKIVDLVKMGVTRCKDVQTHLKSFVNDLIRISDMDPPLPTNTRFYPKYGSIYNVVCNTQLSLKRNNPNPAHIDPIEISNFTEHHFLSTGSIEEGLVEIATSCDNKSALREIRKLYNRTSRLTDKLINRCSRLTDSQCLQLVNSSLENIIRYVEERPAIREQGRIESETLTL